MTREEAEEYAKGMSYRNAVYNALQGKCIPYRKATLIKLYGLLGKIEPQDEEVITNQEWLSHISPEEWVRVVHWLYHDYGTRFADSEGAIIQWLQQDMRKEQSNADSN